MTNTKRIEGKATVQYKYDTFNPYVFRQIPDRARVLDVGCGTGCLGKRLRKRKKISFLAGIEKDPGMAEIARNEYNEVIICDLEENGDLPFEKRYFDIIICADVLEHLRHPVEVLKNLSAYLSETGFFIISVPNVAFVTVRVSLLLGKFNYSSEGGILDETHLRFFTRKSFIETLKRANLEPFYIRGYNLVQPKFFFLKILGLMFPALFSIQFLIKARKVNRNE